MNEAGETVRAAGNETAATMLARAARDWPDATAIIVDDARLTWAELYAEARHWARALRGAGVAPGAHVGILMPNSMDYVRLFYATGMIGAVALTINSRFKDDDLGYAVRHSDMDVLFIGGHALPHVDFRAMLTRIYPDLDIWNGGPLDLEDAPRLRAIYNLADSRETRWPTEQDFLKASDTIPEARIDALMASTSPDDHALMMYSSGTTAHPKACMITHRTLSMIGQSFAERFDLSVEDSVMNPLPFFHMSTMLPMAACRASGAAQICTAHFDPGRTLAQMESERVSFGYLSFPTLVNQVIQHPDFASRDLTSLRFLHTVGPADLMQKYTKVFPGAHYINAYGLTEATGVCCYTDPLDPADQATTVSGRVFDGVRAKAVDPTTLEDVPFGERGEIWIGGFCLFDGYYKDPEKTAETLVDGGQWLRTGDMGYVSQDGHITYDGRLKDMLKIGGENVAALEIETYLCSHPDIQIAQVIGVEDDHLFEVAAAFVELVPGATLTPEAVVDYCIDQIASYKIPRYVRIVDSWPMSTTKIQKFKLPRAFAREEKIDPKSRPRSG
ncbi:class I adenylate-forming enzyme family protein [Palleronia abyssalis]|uniref:3-[(3aS,4S,7aS)-7a-methyl-1, 5-dioxo-octahydro-1H-inden-4-yl]propanoyl:CoA ligase n=1 Tax=Palleronia abyssalis TaxID=1501240 RepID=A0A2R8C100_9RHOB|nr:AMP-binding protein [Palleronia abyssalis]SPJ26039.1 3-[(3aS,4S,7aS)-7a-methyl-1, 5-dioxo-octahydro-1H-inden-4-yl]propanoyl:CoA ligase [Palleronia abyssalis]